jgi:hypothetical protein
VAHMRAKTDASCARDSSIFVLTISDRWRPHSWNTAEKREVSRTETAVSCNIYQTTAKGLGKFPPANEIRI